MRYGSGKESGPSVKTFVDQRKSARDIYEKTAYFLDCNSFLQYKATGVMAVKHDHPGIAKKDPMIQTYIDATYADIDAAKLGPTDSGL